MSNNEEGLDASELDEELDELEEELDEELDEFGGVEPLFVVAHAFASILMSSFSLAVRSPPTAPVLTYGASVATARCAMVVSSVSPLRWETTGA